MPAVIHFDPYTISRELELRVGHPFDPTHEGLGVGWITSTMAPDDLAITYELDPPSASWRELHVDLSATLPRSALDEILPHANASADADLVVSVRCPATHSRQSIVLETTEEGQWTGDLVLNRPQIRNVVELRPALVRTKTIPGAGSESVGTELGAVLAEGRAIRLVIDPSEAPIRGALDVVWEDFRESNNDWRQGHSSDLQFLDFAPGDPKLWLNSRYEKLKAALHSRQEGGVVDMLKSMGNAMLAQTAWLQLAVTAVGSIRVDAESGVASPPDGWGGRVLEIIAPRLLPEAPESDRLLELYERFRDPDRLPSLISQMGSAVQEQLPTYKWVEAAIRAGEKIDE